MHACDRYPFEQSSRDERIFILADLIAFRDIGIKIVLPIKLGEVGNGGTNRFSHLENVFDRFLIDDRQSTRMRHTYGANIHIGALLLGVVLGVTEHFGLCFQLRVHLQSYRCFILHGFTLYQNI